jgi:hypothetical protein
VAHFARFHVELFPAFGGQTVEFRAPMILTIGNISGTTAAERYPLGSNASQASMPNLDHAN